MDCNMDNNTKKQCRQNESTLNPPTILSHGMMIKALITNKNNPKVTKVIGKVNITKMGLINIKWSKTTALKRRENAQGTPICTSFGFGRCGCLAKPPTVTEGCRCLCAFFVPLHHCSRGVARGHQCLLLRIQRNFSRLSCICCSYISMLNYRCCVCEIGAGNSTG
jgi:hypothetical protein